MFIYLFYLFIYLGFYVTFNTVQVISRWVVGRAEETSTYSSSGFCTVNCRPAASNYQLSHFRLCSEPNPGLRGGRRECYHSAWNHYESRQYKDFSELLLSAPHSGKRSFSHHIIPKTKGLEESLVMGVFQWS